MSTEPENVKMKRIIKLLEQEDSP